MILMWAMDTNLSLANLLVTIFLISAPIAPETRAQTVQCFNSDSCQRSEELDPMTIEDCCLNNPDGLTFQRFGSETCEPCIVYGFFKESVTQPEQGPRYTIQLGYMKGARAPGVTTLEFDVKNSPGTAREGVEFDYNVNTNFVRVIGSAPNRVENVEYILHMDSIAQEVNETFSIVLVPSLRPGTSQPTGDGVFFRNTLEVTIIDSDDVHIALTECDYQANERSIMPIRVYKNSRIANPIILDVIPLTVMDASTRSPGLPCNVPEDNGFSPPYATTPDFDNAAIRITFNPDEGADDNERFTPIAITNDAINEAIEQVFIVHLVLVNSSNPSLIDLSLRATSLCRIIDDDTISIGFELPGYTYNEPMFEMQINENFSSPNNLTTYGPVYLIKENNITSEQMFMIVIQVSDVVPDGTNPAALAEDYEIKGGHIVTIPFLPNQQRVNYEFRLFPDNISEGTEALFAIASRADTFEADGRVFNLPHYLPPAFPSTSINILDDDPIIIGFENTSFTVEESVIMFNVYVVVTNPPLDVQLFASIDLVIQTTALTATGGVDYKELNAEHLDVFLAFNDQTRRARFSVEILDDNIFEKMEDFNLELRFDPFIYTSPTAVRLDPNIATVYIQDNDRN